MSKWADRLKRGLDDRQQGKPDVVERRRRRETKAIKVTEESKNEERRTGSVLRSAMKRKRETEGDDET